MQKQIKKITLTFLASLALSLLLAIPVGEFYDNLVKPVRWFWGMENPEYLDGFLFSYIIIVVILMMAFLQEKRIKFSLIFSLPVLILFLSPPYEYLIIGAGLIIIGFLLGQLIFFLKSKFKLSSRS